MAPYFRAAYDSLLRPLLAAGLLGGCQVPAPLAGPPPRPLTRRLPAAQVLADLVLFQRIKEAADAGLYKYHAKAQLDSAFTAARAQVRGPLTVPQVYRLVAGLTDYEGSLHNDTALPDSVARALHAETAFFPYPLAQVAGRVVLNTARAPLPLGAVVHSINGISAGRLGRELGRYYTTDGVNLSGKTVGFAADFPEYYRLEYGLQSAFTVCYSAPGRPDTLRRTLPAVTYASYEQAFSARHSQPLDQAFFDDPPAQYTFELLPTQHAAVLTLSTFDIGEDDTPGHRRYARFLDSCFALLRRTPAIASLLVDVRANGGGDDNNDMLAFSYLVHRPFREHRQARVRFGRVPYRQYLTVAHDTAERAALVAEAERELRTDFEPGPAGQQRENPAGNLVFQPRPNRFRGRLYLLISPRVASAGSMFAAMVRGNTPAVVLGEETMGGYYGHTGHHTLAYTLPYSGVQTSFAWVDLVQDVPPRASQPPGRGTLPDYAVAQSLTDFLANRDTQFRFALRLIARQPNKCN